MRSWRREAHSVALSAAFAAAIAVLLKGPVALALIGPAAMAWLALERPRVPIASWFLIPLVVAAVSLPWFVWANSATDGEFFRVFFWHHTIARFSGSSPLLASYPWWYYLPRFAVDFLPWTPALDRARRLGVRHAAMANGPALPLRVDRLHGHVRGPVDGAVQACRLPAAGYSFAAIAFGCAAEAWLGIAQPTRVPSGSRSGPS